MRTEKETADDAGRIVNGGRETRYWLKMEDLWLILSKTAERMRQKLGMHSTMEQKENEQADSFSSLTVSNAKSEQLSIHDVFLTSDSNLESDVTSSNRPVPWKALGTAFVGFVTANFLLAIFLRYKVKRPTGNFGGRRVDSSVSYNSDSKTGQGRSRAFSETDGQGSEKIKTALDYISLLPKERRKR